VEDSPSPPKSGSIFLGIFQGGLQDGADASRLFARLCHSLPPDEACIFQLINSLPEDKPMAATFAYAVGSELVGLSPFAFGALLDFTRHSPVAAAAGFRFALVRLAANFLVEREDEVGVVGEGQDGSQKEQQELDQLQHDLQSNVSRFVEARLGAGLLVVVGEGPEPPKHTLKTLQTLCTSGPWPGAGSLPFLDIHGNSESVFSVPSIAIAEVLVSILAGADIDSTEAGLQPLDGSVGTVDSSTSPLLTFWHPSVSRWLTSHQDRAATLARVLLHHFATMEVEDRQEGK